MRISDWSSDVCSSDLAGTPLLSWEVLKLSTATKRDRPMNRMVSAIVSLAQHLHAIRHTPQDYRPAACPHCGLGRLWRHRSEEHTSELQSLMRISYAVFCLKKKNSHNINKRTHNTTS